MSGSGTPRPETSATARSPRAPPPGCCCPASPTHRRRPTSPPGSPTCRRRRRSSPGGATAASWRLRCRPSRSSAAGPWSVPRRPAEPPRGGRWRRRRPRTGRPPSRREWPEATARRFPAGPETGRVAATALGEALPPGGGRLPRPVDPGRADRPRLGARRRVRPLPRARRLGARRHRRLVPADRGRRRRPRDGVGGGGDPPARSGLVPGLGDCSRIGPTGSGGGARPPPPGPPFGRLRTAFLLGSAASGGRVRLGADDLALLARYGVDLVTPEDRPATS